MPTGQSISPFIAVGRSGAGTATGRSRPRPC